MLRTRAPVRAGTVVGLAAVAVVLGTVRAVAAEPPPTLDRDVVAVVDMAQQPVAISPEQAAQLFGSLLPAEVNMVIAGDSYPAGLGAGLPTSRGNWQGGLYFDPTDPRGQSMLSAPLQAIVGSALSAPGTQFNAHVVARAGDTIANVVSPFNPADLRAYSQLDAFTPATDFGLLWAGGNTINFPQIATAAANQYWTELNFNDLVAAAARQLDLGLPADEYVNQARNYTPGTAPTVTAQVIDMILSAHERAPNAQLAIGTYPNFANPELAAGPITEEELTTGGLVIQALNGNIRLGAELANHICGGCVTVAEMEGVLPGQYGMYGDLSGVNDISRFGARPNEMAHLNGWGARLAAVPINETIAAYIGLPQSVFGTMNGLPNQPPWEAGWWSNTALTFTLPGAVPNLTVRTSPPMPAMAGFLGFPGVVAAPRWGGGFVVSAPPSPPAQPFGAGPIMGSTTAWAGWNDVLASGLVEPDEPADPQAGSMIVGDAYTGFAPDVSGALGPGPGSSLVDADGDSGWADYGQMSGIEGSGVTAGPDMSPLSESDYSDMNSLGEPQSIDPGSIGGWGGETGGGNAGTQGAAAGSSRDGDSGWADYGQMSGIEGSGVTAGPDMSPLSESDYSDMNSLGEPQSIDPGNFGGWGGETGGIDNTHGSVDSGVSTAGGDYGNDYGGSYAGDYSDSYGGDAGAYV